MTGDGAETLKTLPGDDIRQIMWRFSDRYDLQMLVQSTRTVARSVVAKMVASGERKFHEWTPAKQNMLKCFDESGITAAFMDPEMGGFVEGPKNMAVALVAFELAWVDGGSATCSLAGNLALAPICERGTEEQRRYYLSQSVPPQPNEDRKQLRGAFALTEPLPYVGVDTGVLCGKIKVAEWKEGQEPILEVQKRGRFITNMDFANFVTAAVDSADPRIKGSCMIVVHEDDEGTFDRGAITLKMVHQLSSTRDPIITAKVPASRIVGGYKIKDGVIVPNYNHGDVIEATFRRTRVTVGLMTAAKLLSAVEPIIRYQRQRFRGGEGTNPGTPRFEAGLQMKEDPLHRLVDVWAAGEAASSLGFGAAYLLDNFDTIEHWRDSYFKEQQIEGARAQLKVFKSVTPQALEFIKLAATPDSARDAARYEELLNDKLVQFVVGDALSNVLCPACKLWDTGYGATMMREAVSLMGGYGITEDCPGFLMQKWTDAQLEATYEGPEAVQRRHLSATMTNEVFLAQFEQWIVEQDRLAEKYCAAGITAQVMRMWLWCVRYLLKTKDAKGKVLYHNQRQSVTFPLADALCWVLASRFQILDVVELAEKGQDNPAVTDGLSGCVNFLSDLCTVQAAHAAGEVGRICTELVYGYRESGAVDSCDQLKEFEDLRAETDRRLVGFRFAKDRAAQALTTVMIPEALDYPQL